MELKDIEPRRVGVVSGLSKDGKYHIAITAEVNFSRDYVCYCLSKGNTVVRQFGELDLEEILAEYDRLIEG